MPFVPAPNIVMVEWRCLNALQRIENRIMVNMLTAPTAPEMSDLVDLAINWWDSAASVQMSSTVALTEVVATDMSTLNGIQISAAPGTPVTGVDNSGAKPNEVSFCVSLRTGNRGRSARGRLYWLAITNDQMQDANNMKSAKANDIIGACNVLREDIATAGWQWSIVSYRTNNAPRPGGPVYFPITTCIYTDLLVDSMKRRKPGVGT
jgi:hypothetical protein